MSKIRLEVNGHRCIIRDVRKNTEREFEAYYRGYHIVITVMAEQSKQARRRNSLTVAGPDGILIVDTWDYHNENPRSRQLEKAVRNILSTESLARGAPAVLS